MGEDKALVPIAGAPMINWVAAALAGACDGFVVAGREPGWLGFDAVRDRSEAHQGPLAALCSIALAYPDRQLLLVAVDQPWLLPATVGRLASKADLGVAVIPVENGQRQTLCAIYPEGLGDLANDELGAGGSIQSLLDRISFEPVIASEWSSWGEDGRSWFSCDTADAIEIGITAFGTPGGAVRPEPAT